MIKTIFFGIAIWLCLSCSKKAEGPVPIVSAPESYTFTRDGESTVSFSGQTIRIKMATELVKAMKESDETEKHLLEMYANETALGGDADPFEEKSLNESTKSVKSKVAASTDFFKENTQGSATIKTQIEDWIKKQVTEVFPKKDSKATKGSAGKIDDGTSARYVNAKGLEYDQAVNKALIGALMLDQMCNNYLSKSVLDAGSNRSDNDAGTLDEDEKYTSMEHKWDEAYGYLFGSAPKPATPLETLGDDDIFLNKYMGRVKSQGFDNIASEIFNAFKLGRAAIVAHNYNVRDEQAEILRKKLSEAIGIRSVYYLKSAKVELEASNLGGVFHDLSEGLGFIYSLQFTRKPDSDAPYFSKTEVDGFISMLMEGNGFWDAKASTLDEIANAIATKFDFTVEQASPK